MNYRFKESEERVRNYANRVNLMEEDINYICGILIAAYDLGIEVGKKQGKEIAMLEVQSKIKLARMDLGLGL